MLKRADYVFRDRAEHFDCATFGRELAGQAGVAEKRDRLARPGQNDRAGALQGLDRLFGKVWEPRR